jgi:hypothetical protein
LSNRSRRKKSFETRSGSQWLRSASRASGRSPQCYLGDELTEHSAPVSRSEGAGDFAGYRRAMRAEVADHEAIGRIGMGWIERYEVDRDA